MFKTWWCGTELFWKTHLSFWDIFGRLVISELLVMLVGLKNDLHGLHLFRSHMSIKNIKRCNFTSTEMSHENFVKE